VAATPAFLAIAYAVRRKAEGGTDGSGR